MKLPTKLRTDIEALEKLVAKVRSGLETWQEELDLDIEAEEDLYEEADGLVDDLTFLEMPLLLILEDN